jgi:subtilisin family serine protease
VALTATAPIATSAALAAPAPLAPAPLAQAPLVLSTAADAVPGQYVVMLKPTVAAASVATTAGSLSNSVDGTVIAQFSRTIRGFTVRTSAEKISKLAADTRVAGIYQDRVVRADTVQPIPAPPSSPWGLDRIDQRNLPLSRSYAYVRGASNVRAYVLDTGIRVSHSQFGGRATFGFTATGLPEPGVDCHGHGTHVAGTIGGSTFGVAKLVRLVAVKVLDCEGSATETQVMEGIEWVTANAVLPAVANMSLGGPKFPPLNAAVAASIDRGVTYVVSAGNSNAPAYDFSPASTPAAITVGSTGNADNPTNPVTDARSFFSNFGQAVDIFAPGAFIRSTWNLSDTSTNTISGTSMAAPHTAGAAALYLGVFPSSIPETVRDALIARSTAGKVTNPGTGSPNRLLYAYI